MLAPPAAADIIAAHYDAPTSRYSHGVLGDAIEWGALVLALDDGRRLRVTLPDSSVFEDTAPRLADVDGDGNNEVVVVESSLVLGARLAIHDETGLLAATPHIGRRYRWLAPVAVADLDGDGATELAWIDRPHLARTLRIWRYRDGRLFPVAERTGLTNHRIGWNFIAGGLRDCGAFPEMILASGDWTRILAARLVSGRIELRDLGPYRGPESLAAARRCF